MFNVIADANLKQQIESQLKDFISNGVPIENVTLAHNRIQITGMTELDTGLGKINVLLNPYLPKDQIFLYDNRPTSWIKV